jgi:hypothetical protein
MTGERPLHRGLSFQCHDWEQPKETFPDAPSVGSAKASLPVTTFSRQPSNRLGIDAVDAGRPCRLLALLRLGKGYERRPLSVRPRTSLLWSSAASFHLRATTLRLLLASLPLRQMAARALSAPGGRRGSDLPHLDGRQPLAAGFVSRAARRQASTAGGAANSIRHDGRQSQNPTHCRVSRGLESGGNYQPEGNSFHGQKRP